MKYSLALLSLSLHCIKAGLLGAGTGAGSCRAAPYRSAVVQWTSGCPEYASCCSEYGYCRGQDEWIAGGFRDCNGQSNGRPLAADAVAAEQAAAAAGDTRGLSLLGASIIRTSPSLATPLVTQQAEGVLVGSGSSGPLPGTILGEVTLGTDSGTVNVPTNGVVLIGGQNLGVATAATGIQGFKTASSSLVSLNTPNGGSLSSGSVGQNLNSGGLLKTGGFSGSTFLSKLGYVDSTGHEAVVGIKPASTQLLAYGGKNICKFSSGYYYC